jgi:hypothetical protein
MANDHPPPLVDDLVANIIDNNLDDYLKDKQTATQIITWISEETGLPRLGVRLAYHWLTPLVLARVKVAGNAFARSAFGSLSERLLRLPGFDRIGKAALALNRKLSQKTEERRILDAILAGARPAEAAEDLNTLAFDEKLAFKQLAAIQELDSELRRSFETLLDRLSPQPLLVLDILERRESNRHFYGVQRVPFVDRTAELAALEEFLLVDRRFAWWGLKGPTGIGKRRLALELCLRQATAWRGGVLPYGNGFQNNWAAWQPERPTLIVLHGQRRAQEAGAIIAVLAQRAAELDWPVRLLLSTSENDDKTRQRLEALPDAVPDDRRRYYIDDSHHRKILELPGLSADGLWDCLRSVMIDSGRFAMPPREQTLQRLAMLDSLGRPLFAIFAAEALAEGRDVNQLDRNQVIQHVLSRELGLWRSSGVTPQDKNLLALTTVTDGLDLRVLKHPPIADFLPSPATYDPKRYSLMSGQPSHAFLAPKEPAIIGQLFVLEHLKPEHALDERAAQVCRAALEVDPALLPALSSGDKRDESGTGREALFQMFFKSAAQGLPGHPTLAFLRQPPPANRSPFSWGMHTAALIEGLEEPENLPLCRSLYDDLWRIAAEERRAQTNTIRLRLAQCAVTLLMRYANVPDMREAGSIYRGLERLQAEDPELSIKDRWPTVLSILAIGFAGTNDVDTARKYYDLLRTWVDKTPDFEGGPFTTALTAKMLLRAHVRSGELSIAKDLYNDIRSDAQHGPADAVRQRGDALSSLIAAYSRAGDPEQARESFDEFTALCEERELASQDRREKRSYPQADIAGAFTGLILTSLGLRSGLLKKTPAQEANEQAAGLREMWMHASRELLIAYEEKEDRTGARQVYMDIRNILSLPDVPRATMESFAYAAITLLLGEAYKPGGMETAKEAFEDIMRVSDVMQGEGYLGAYAAQAAYTLVRLLLEQGAQADARDVSNRAAPVLDRPEAAALIEQNEGKDMAASFFEFVNDSRR